MRNNRFTGFILLISFIIILVPSLFAQKTDIRVDGQEIKNLIAYMSQDKYLGRKPLTPEYDELCNWAAGNFSRWGLEPAGDSGTFFQAVPITGRRGAFAFSTGTPKMVIDGREFFVHYGDFTVDYRFTPGKKFRGEIVFAGYGISAAEKRLDEYKSIDVRNKFVFVLKGSPADVEAPRGFFSPDQAEPDSIEKWATISSDSSKIFTAYKKGAAGIIFYNPESDQQSRFRRAPVEKPTFTRDFIIVSDVNEGVQWRRR